MIVHVEQELLQEQEQESRLYQEIFYRKKYHSLHSGYYALLQMFLCQKALVLDVRAGLGDLATYLAGKGYSMIALEQSRKLLDLARARSAVTRGAVDYRMGDIRHLDFTEHVNAVIARNTLAGIHQPDDLLQVFSAVHAHLMDYGVFIFDFPTESECVSKRSEIVRETLGGIPFGRIMTIMRQQRYLASEQLGLIDWQVVSPHYQLKSRSCIKIYEKEGLQDLLQRAGFHYVRFFDGSTLTEHAPLEEARPDSRMVIGVARKIAFEEDLTHGGYGV